MENGVGRFLCHCIVNTTLLTARSTNELPSIPFRLDKSSDIECAKLFGRKICNIALTRVDVVS